MFKQLRKSVFFSSFFLPMDPDPDSESGSTQANESGSVPDPDPQPCFFPVLAVLNLGIFYSKDLLSEKRPQV
jgi:hypothetical protein